MYEYRFLHHSCVKLSLPDCYHYYYFAVFSSSFDEEEPKKKRPKMAEEKSGTRECKK